MRLVQATNWEVTLIGFPSSCSNNILWRSFLQSYAHLQVVTAVVIIVSSWNVEGILYIHKPHWDYCCPGSYIATELYMF